MKKRFLILPLRPAGEKEKAPPLRGSCRRSRLRGVKTLILCILILSLTACAPRVEETSTTVFAMDTVMNLTVYHDGTQADTVQQGVSDLYAYEALFSATREGSDIHKINTNCGNSVTVSAETADLLTCALDLCEQTGGALDMTAYPAVQAWGFTTGEYRIPDEGELSTLASNIDYTRVEMDGQNVTLPAGMELDSGAVAKGWAGDRLKERFRGMGVTSALLDLGQSTITAIGGKPDGSPFRIGIQDPHGDSYLGVLDLTDQSMGSSGNYQRFFEENGVRYGHILDPDTAAPADSGLAGVTVVADSALLCDGLSTALFVMGLEEAADYWRAYRDFDAIFIEENGNITITAGLKDSFSLRDGYTDREVTVLE